MKWQDKITNIEVLQRSGLPTLTSTLHSRRLRWIGHVRRMSNDRIPKQVLFGELSESKRPRGRPKLRYKDVRKNSLCDFDRNHETWESLTVDRFTCRDTLRRGLATSESTQIAKMEEQRRKRKAKDQHGILFQRSS
jgi:hypothetical protein